MRQKRSQRTNVRAHQILGGEQQSVVDGALRHVDPPVHEQFAEMQLGIDYEASLRGAVVEAQRNFLHRTVADDETMSVGCFYLHRSCFYEAGKKVLKQLVHSIRLLCIPRQREIERPNQVVGDGPL